MVVLGTTCGLTGIDQSDLRDPALKLREVFGVASMQVGVAQKDHRTGRRPAVHRLDQLADLRPASGVVVLTAAGGAVQESDSEGRMVEREELVKPVQQINEVLRRYGVEFQLSEDSGRTVIRLIDRDNGELIRQIPPEEALNAAQRLEEMKGRLLNLEV